MLDEIEIKALLDEHENAMRGERVRLDRIKDYMEGKHKKPYRPSSDHTDVQYNILAERSTINMMPMIRNAPASQLQVSGVSAGQDDADVKAWDLWQSNGFDNRSVQIFTSAITYGYAFGYAFRNPNGTVVMRGKSARHMYAVYEDPVSDEYPEYAFFINEAGDVTEVWDNTHWHRIVKVEFVDSVGTSHTILQIDEMGPHGAPNYCPVVQFAPDKDLDGNAIGIIEPAIDAQDRLNQGSFDLLLAQHYTAFRIRGFSGVTQALDKKTGKPVPLKLDPSRVPMLPNADSKAWQLDGTDLSGFIRALEGATHDLMVVSQTPIHFALGNIANLAADALTEAKIPLTSRVKAFKQTLGESVELLLRTTSDISGFDFPEDAEIVWADLEPRSLSLVADAISKLIAAGVPQEALWAMIPGITKTMIQQWRNMAPVELDSTPNEPVPETGS